MWLVVSKEVELGFGCEQPRPFLTHPASNVAGMTVHRELQTFLYAKFRYDTY